jgi:hypothetical protein
MWGNSNTIDEQTVAQNNEGFMLRRIHAVKLSHKLNQNFGQKFAMINPFIKKL